jgi:hypothetical protein
VGSFRGFILFSIQLWPWPGTKPKPRTLLPLVPTIMGPSEWGPSDLRFKTSHPPNSHRSSATFRGLFLVWSTGKLPAVSVQSTRDAQRFRRNRLGVDNNRSGQARPLYSHHGYAFVALWFLRYCILHTVPSHSTLSRGCGCHRATRILGNVTTGDVQPS